MKMELISTDTQLKFRRKNEWRCTDRSLLVILYISLLTIQCNCQTIINKSSHESLTKSIDNLDSKVDSKNCHSCQISNNKIDSSKNSKTNLMNEENYETDEKSTTESFVEDVLNTFNKLCLKVFNKTKTQIQDEFEKVLDDTLSRDRYVLIDGIEIKTIANNVTNDHTDIRRGKSYDVSEKRALFSKFSYEYRIFQKIKNFVETHLLSINLPKAARLIGFRSFGLKKFFIPLLIGAQVFKSILLAMFLPSILGSFGKILGKGISTLSASSSQASYPPAQEDQGYSNDNKDFVGYESDPAGAYAYPQDGMYMNDVNDINDLANVDMSRFGEGGQKISYLPSKPGYYKNQLTSASNNYKVFQKIPASSMILSNYDPFYSPLLSRLDGIFARLGLAPVENEVPDGKIGGQSLSSVKLEACREQLICLMYSSPAKYAPYSNLVSAQLSRELNELRRPVSDNPEILRFFRYMRAARRGQEGTDCMRAHAACSANAAPAHTMIAAYHDINKLVTARKLHN